ncbi:MAG: 2Fe-2S iron-sulfur cluster binding domain-containing protein [Rhodospirillaceae bacterium]|nr:2Fe-2S iron-sulfur cluster binding domain-containing protein [Rhodospirillaceae bacterium]MBT3492875.1 2Fe-2S iron-sulfur cluster binding domain-containing protein [Rhodospirillaceae bacterium]MBT3779945.1 2Fe-2S iron-sulfur cluster binding domain-containing protein [Rhodospirillaceae bacterium]MBT3976727.1 2Fe-2S iron-sulfur cluster binding domain-containing protein [Rhodospirillaceae bacterium]MBT4169488.1 2Fe-2S iron-sulfur cluster binding domain-containing protein [Rhodospirillaceae bact
MVKVTYIESNGVERVTALRLGQTLMDGAIDNEVEGVMAECGGLCACSTCHVYVEDAWLQACGEPSELEEGMLDFAADLRANSRLSCQIQITEAMDGMVVRVPERQY